MSTQNKGGRIKKMNALRRFEKMHPHKTFMFFAIIASTLTFLALILLYAIRMVEFHFLQFSLPKLFSVSTVVLLFSSYTMTRCLPAFKADDMTDLRISLLLTMILATVFCITQIFSWQQIYTTDTIINSQPGVSFLYLITAFHLLHVLLGFVLIAYLNFNAYVAANDMVKKLMFFSNKREANKLELVSVYWHFVDFMWLFLYFIFLFSF